MSQKDKIQLVLQEIKEKSQNDHDLLVRSLFNMYALNNSGLKTFVRTAVATTKVDPKTIHTYNPLDAYKPSALESGYKGKPNRHNVVY